MLRSTRRNFLYSLAGSWALSALPAAAAYGSPVYKGSTLNEHDGLPRGAVEVFGRNSRVPIQRQLLSLSATDPRGLAISRDGRFLAVAAYGGGVYNVLPIEADGMLGAVSGIFKELGSGPHPVEQRSAHPHSLVFDATGKFLLSSDFGCDRLSVFTLSGNGKLARRSQFQLKPGSGPGAISLNGDLLSVHHDLLGTRGRYRFDAATGTINAEDSLAG